MLTRSLRLNKANLLGLQRNVSTVGSILNEAATRLPMMNAIKHKDDKVDFTFEELKKYSDDFARHLVDMEYSAGETLAVWLPNCTENLVAQLACAKTGVRLASIDPTISNPEHIEYILKDSNCRALLFHPKLNGVATTPILQNLLPELNRTESPYRPIQSRKFRSLRALITTEREYHLGIFQFRYSMVADMIPNPLDKLEAAITPETPLVITYTNDGNQLPRKSNVQTHGDLVKKIEELSKKSNLTSADRVCLGEPIVGINIPAMACIHSNSQMIIPSWENDKEAFDHAVKEQKCNYYYTSDGKFSRI